MSLPLASGTWTLDAAHSSVEFVARHLGLSKVRGRFGTFDATLVVGSELADSRLSAEVDLASVSTNNADRDAHLRGSDFFSVETHPTMTFVSRSITGSGDDYRLVGDLTINGVTKPLELEVEFNGTEVFPLDQQLHAGFSASGTLSRADFDIEFDVPLGADKLMIGDKVRIEIEAQLVAATVAA